ncbi:HEPN domain-containing protein [Rhizobium tubonense]|uniref:Nucleotidyltransferase n=1 Tax=Rhizobium tubonense TaxID=484088 RepID=A0A2W4CAX5_9HYPH|nr:HEPN domain-containing protein [Rhizobium tubonense]PZM10467.1 nucleotidyltransferase [Rhizobium tubonense]
MDTIPHEDFDAALTLTDTLDHLPANKRRELARVLEILFDEVQTFQAHKQSDRKTGGKILKVILYGSYARGDWVEDRASGYRSDYDLLIVVNREGFAQEEDLWLALDERLIQAQIAHHIHTPVVPIVHSLADVNDQLARGRPFFIDIARDGKILYEAPGHPLAEPKPLTPEASRNEAQANFDQWFDGASRMLALASDAMDRAFPNETAFLLHQTTERFYHCLLLTLTLYSPKLHRIKTLRSKAEDIDNRLIAAWPRDTRIVRRRFELLSRAYVEARYSSQYNITVEELEWLTERAKILQHLVDQICRERLEVGG